MRDKILIVISFLVLSLLISGCGAKLQDGKEEAVSFKDVDGITAEDFYKLLKDKYAASEIVDLIDETLLAKEYEKTTDEDAYVNENMESIKSQAGDQFDAYIKQYYNADSEKELEDMLRLSYKRNEWIQDYVEDSVTDDEIKKYYDEKIIGDMELKHILITPDVASDATDAEKTKAEEAAKTQAEKIIKELDNGAKWDDLAKKYSKDESNKDKGGDLGYINREGYDENFIEGAIPLKKGKYTKEPVKSSFGYHIILKEDQKSKPKLDDEKKDEIRTKVAEEKLASDSELSLKALEALREKYDMKINDSDLKKAYEETVDAMYENTNSAATTTN